MKLILKEGEKTPHFIQSSKLSKDLQFGVVADFCITKKVFLKFLKCI